MNPISSNFIQQGQIADEALDSHYNEDHYNENGVQAVTPKRYVYEASISESKTESCPPLTSKKGGSITIKLPQANLLSKIPKDLAKESSHEVLGGLTATEKNYDYSASDVEKLNIKSSSSLENIKPSGEVSDTEEACDIGTITKDISCSQTVDISNYKEKILPSNHVEKVNELNSSLLTLKSYCKDVKKIDNDKSHLTNKVNAFSDLIDSVNIKSLKSSYCKIANGDDSLARLTKFSCEINQFILTCDECYSKLASELMKQASDNPKGLVDLTQQQLDVLTKYLTMFVQLESIAIISIGKEYCFYEDILKHILLASSLSCKADEHLGTGRCKNIKKWKRINEFYTSLSNFVIASSIITLNLEVLKRKGKGLNKNFFEFYDSFLSKQGQVFCGYSPKLMKHIIESEVNNQIILYGIFCNLLLGSNNDAVEMFYQGIIHCNSHDIPKGMLDSGGFTHDHIDILMDSLGKYFKCFVNEVVSEKSNIEACESLIYKQSEILLFTRELTRINSSDNQAWINEFILAFYRGSEYCIEGVKKCSEKEKKQCVEDELNVGSRLSKKTKTKIKSKSKSKIKNPSMDAVGELDKDVNLEKTKIFSPSKIKKNISCSSKSHINTDDIAGVAPLAAGLTKTRKINKEECVKEIKEDLTFNAVNETGYSHGKKKGKINKKLRKAEQLSTPNFTDSKKETHQDKQQDSSSIIGSSSVKKRKSLSQNLIMKTIDDDKDITLQQKPNMALNLVNAEEIKTVIRPKIIVKTKTLDDSKQDINKSKSFNAIQLIVSEASKSNNNSCLIAKDKASSLEVEKEDMLNSVSMMQIHDVEKIIPSSTQNKNNMALPIMNASDTKIVSSREIMEQVDSMDDESKDIITTTSRRGKKKVNKKKKKDESCYGENLAVTFKTEYIGKECVEIVTVSDKVDRAVTAGTIQKSQKHFELIKGEHELGYLKNAYNNLEVGKELTQSLSNKELMGNISSQLNMSVVYCDKNAKTVDVFAPPVQDSNEDSALGKKMIFKNNEEHIEGESIQVNNVRAKCREKLSKYHAAKYPVTCSKISDPILLTGSCSYQNHISHFWEKGVLNEFIMSHDKLNSSGVTKDDIVSTLTPRDTDFVLMPEHDFDEISKEISDLLKSCLAESNLEGVNNLEITINKPDSLNSNAPLIKTGNIVAHEHRPKSHGTKKATIHYIVDIQVCSDELAMKPLFEIVKDSKGLHKVYTRCLGEIIKGELCVLKSHGVGPERIKKALIRLYTLAALEVNQPKLDTASRIALISAVNYLSTEYSTFHKLSQELRKTPLYMIGNDHELFGASKK